MNEQKKWGHDELQNDLADYIRGNSDKLAWTNMPMGSAGNCRPDVFVVPKSFAHFRPIIYEVKISVSDFRSDITSGKWQNYLKYACGVVFAVPQGLITKADVPAGCGLIVRSETGWRSAKAPTLQYLDTLPKELWIKLLIDGIDRQQRLLTSPKFFNEYLVQSKIKQKYGARIAELLSDLSRAEHRIETAKIRANSLADEIEHKRQEALKAASIENSRIDAAKSELCAALGIPTDSSYWSIERRCSELADRLNENEEINRLRKQISDIQQAINKASEPIPQFKVAA